MHLEPLNKIINNIKDVDETSKNAILKLIDIQTESDVEKTLNRMDKIAEGLKAEIDHKTDNLKTEIGYLKWIGSAILIAVLGVIVKSFF